LRKKTEKLAARKNSAKSERKLENTVDLERFGGDSCLKFEKLESKFTWLAKFM